MRADGWNRIPLIRMTNVCLEPGDGTLDELIADTDDGIYHGDEQAAGRSTTSGSTSSSAREIAWEIKSGKLGRMLRDADLHRHHARFWGWLRRGRAARRMGAVGLDELRQGPAGAGRARRARRLAGALPQRPGRRP